MAFDWQLYKGNMTWLPSRTIFVTLHGSHAYGTSLPTSDIDYRGVCIAPKEYYHGFNQVFEHTVQKDPDLTIFELRKFLRLACDVNPNVIELLYTDPSDHLYMDPAWQPMLDVRDSFLSQRARHTFSGYALSQLKRINTHYRWLKNPPKAQPTRGEFGLPETTIIPADQLMAAQSAIQKRVDEWNWHDLEDLEPGLRQMLMDEFTRRLAEITTWGEDAFEERAFLAASRSLGFSTNFIEFLDKERRYGAAKKEWRSFLKWKEERNPARAELEAKFGYDTKHAMHLVRLLRMCEEILTTGKVNVRRDDAADLLRIRAGAWTYEQLIIWAKMMDTKLGGIAKMSKLPRSPDRVKIDVLCRQMVEASFR
jgi:predicted nucleotidyltransferase